MMKNRKMDKDVEYRNARLTEEQKCEFLELMGYGAISRKQLVVIGHELLFSESQTYKFLERMVKKGLISKSRVFDDGRKILYHQKNETIPKVKKTGVALSVN